MNCRQKAKHFKRLYEQSLPQKPYPIIYETLPLIQCRAEYTFPSEERMRVYNPELLKEVVTRQLMSKVKDILVERIKTTEDPYARRVVCKVDFWVRSNEK